MIKLKAILTEKYEIDLEIGDTILRGKFKNKPVVVKDIGTDEHGQPTINGKKMLSFRIKKLMPKKEGTIGVTTEVSVTEAFKKDGHIYNHETVGEKNDNALAGKDGILGDHGVFISWEDVRMLQRKYRGRQ
jgi:hypothetical protein